MLKERVLVENCLVKDEIVIYLLIGVVYVVLDFMNYFYVLSFRRRICRVDGILWKLIGCVMFVWELDIFEEGVNCWNFVFVGVINGIISYFIIF